ncbi:ATP-dependent nuclease [Streptomyces sp. NPDC101116]|uniref:ATP-dependent nuclease n=1 Tax=Streptomyces sp. NPDC101116 TaxID=3366107 RepID=UPI0038271118
MEIVVEPDANPEAFSISIASVELLTGDRLEFPKSGVTAIVGPNNCGKSTLLRQITSHIARGQKVAQQENTFLVRRVTLESSGTLDDGLAWLRQHVVEVERGGVPLLFGPGAEGVRLDAAMFRLKKPEEGLQELNNLLVFYGDAWQRLQGATPIEMREKFSDPPASPLHVLQDDHELFQELNRISMEVFRQPLTLDRLSKRVNLRVGDPGVPTPKIDRVTDEYLSSLASLPELMQQGDGMRSLLGLLVPLVTSTYPIVFIDEPEAFLHPPQATALGRILGEQAKGRGIQIILATHDRNLISGLLESEADVSIVRLNRTVGDKASAHQLNGRDLREIWSDPVLRYSNILEGLFHRLVVLAEADGDCRFYSAALEEAASQLALPFPPGDVLFVPSGGKAGMPKLAKTLRAVNVPVAASPDMDLLNDKSAIKALVQSLGGAWPDYERDYVLATEPFRKPRDKVSVDQILSTLKAVFSERGDEPFTAEIREDFMAQLRSKESPWSEVKQYGELAFKGQAGPALQRLLSQLEALGIVLARVGELERFAPNLGVAKGAAWLPAAIKAGAHKNSAARNHVLALAEVGRSA